VGDASDLGRLLERLEDLHPWPRRGAIYALGLLGLAEAAPRIREELKHSDAEVRLAAVWALGHLRDDGARDALAGLLRTARPARGMARTIASGDGGPRIMSDAEDRLFDSLLQALARLGGAEADRSAARALDEARQRVTEEDLERLAWLPPPETSPETVPPTLRALFEAALPPAEDELGC
jgi:HEAT repeat protein